MSDMQNEVILEARGLHKEYVLGGQVLKILCGVNLKVRRGEMLGIVGSSGVGKSTLLHVLGLLDRPNGGEVDFDGERINYGARHRNAYLRCRRLGFVFQFYHLLPELTALENVVLSAMIGYGPLQWITRRRQARNDAVELLASLGLGQRLKHKPTQLSGGERQRVAIARALLSQPSLLFCDEPTGNLDERTSETIVELLFEINRERKQTMVVVTHNESMAERMPRLLRLTEGRLQKV